MTAAAAIAAVKLTPEQKKMMIDGVLGDRNSALRVRGLHLPNSVAPTAVFNPVPAGTPGPQPAPAQPVVLGAAPSVEGISAVAGRQGCLRDDPSAWRAAARPQGHLRRADEAVSLATQALRPDAALRHHAHGRARARHRPLPPIANSPAATIAARCTAFPGARRICSPSKAIPRPGVQPASSIRASTRTPRWSSVSTPPALFSSRS